MLIKVVEIKTLNKFYFFLFTNSYQLLIKKNFLKTRKFYLMDLSYNFLNNSNLIIWI